MKKIVVYGSINVDLAINTPRIPNDGETINGNNFYRSCGGKGANQAVAAARLGANVQMIGCIGDDSFGKETLLSLKRNNVGTTYVKVLEEVTSGVAIIIRQGVNNRIIIDKGANQHLSINQLLEFNEKHSVENEIFITQLENDLDKTMEALAFAKSKNMLTVLNPAPAVEITESNYKNIDILILNQSETEILSGIYPESEIECKEAYTHFSKLGVKQLIITLGKSGSYVFNEKHFLKVNPESVKVVDTVGAGDSYIGGLTYMLSKGSDIFVAAKFAGKVASLTITKEGAQSSMPSLEEVQKYEYWRNKDE
jgi:ribokinase